MCGAGNVLCGEVSANPMHGGTRYTKVHAVGQRRAAEGTVCHDTPSGTRANGAGAKSKRSGKRAPTRATCRSRVLCMLSAATATATTTLPLAGSANASSPSAGSTKTGRSSTRRRSPPRRSGRSSRRTAVCSTAPRSRAPAPCAGTCEWSLKRRLLGLRTPAWTAIVVADQGLAGRLSAEELGARWAAYLSDKVCLADSHGLTPGTGAATPPRRAGGRAAPQGVRAQGGALHVRAAGGHGVPGRARA